MSTDAEKDRIRKQQFLIDAVMKEGYNTDIFAGFLKSKKEDGANIENWSF